MACAGLTMHRYSPCDLLETAKKKMKPNLGLSGLRKSDGLNIRSPCRDPTPWTSAFPDAVLAPHFQTCVPYPEELEYTQ